MRLLVVLDAVLSDVSFQKLDSVNAGIFLIWMTRPYILTLEQARPLGEMIYPIDVAQACLTTGLITFKIWRQHLKSRAAGLGAQSGVGLRTIIRMIVESAMISTVQQVIMAALFYMDKPAVWIVHGTLVPSLGMCLVSSTDPDI